MMNEEQMLMCLIAFILGYLVSRHMGSGFRVGGRALSLPQTCKTPTALKNQLNQIMAGVDEICHATDGCIPSCKGTNTYKGKTIDNCNDADKDGNIGGDKCSWINGSGNAADGSWVNIGDGAKIGIGTQCITGAFGSGAGRCTGFGQKDGEYNLCKIKSPPPQI
jgi:hypothetical protein